MASFFDDNPDLQFYFARGVDWQSMVDLTDGLGERERVPAAHLLAEVADDGVCHALEVASIEDRVGRYGAADERFGVAGARKLAG